MCECVCIYVCVNMKNKDMREAFLSSLCVHCTTTEDKNRVSKNVQNILIHTHIHTYTYTNEVTAW